MLKARKGKNIILGLDRENIKRLQQLKPIRIVGKDLNIEQDIYIIYGETLQDIAIELEIETHRNKH